MSSLLPRQVDPYRLAEREEHLQGNIAAAELGRLREAAELLSEQVPVKLAFRQEAEGHVIISGHVAAEVELTCQRCLQPMPVKLDAGMNLVVVASEQEALQVAGDYDPVISGSDKRLDISAIIEDELILALPIVVYHENEKDCSLSSDYLAVAGDQPDEEEGSSNPFEILKQLKEDD